MLLADLRHRCRNPHCRAQLPRPVSNSRNAFCCQACYVSFYHLRCLICEDPFERTSANQKVCGKRKCRAGLRSAWVRVSSAGTQMALSYILKLILLIFQKQNRPSNPTEHGRSSLARN